MLRIYSWWNDAEKGPFESVRTGFQAQHPNVSIDNPKSDMASNQRDAVAGELLAGVPSTSPPSSFQANVGADVLRWARVETEKGQHDLLSDLSTRLPAGAYADFAKSLPQEIQDGLTIGTSGLLAVPLNIHRLNMVYYNRAKFAEQMGGERDFLSIDELCPEHPESAPKLPVTIAIGNADDFSLSLLTFESMLPALTDAPFYTELMRGGEPSPPGDGGDYIAPLRHAIACVQYLAKSFKTFSKWDDALGDVAGGRSALTFSGDWANLTIATALVKSDAGEPPTVVGTPFPFKYEETFVFTSDTFPLPLNAPHMQETEQFLEYMMRASTQAKFNDEKGSIPARLGTPIGGALQDLREEQLAAFIKYKRAMATSGMFPSGFPGGELTKLLGEMTSPPFDSGKVDEVLEQFLAARPLLAHWVNQLEQ